MTIKIVVLLTGFICVITGAALAYRPLGWLVCGAGLMTAALLSKKANNGN